MPDAMTRLRAICADPTGGHDCRSATRANLSGANLRGANLWDASPATPWGAQQTGGSDAAAR